jgi:RimJ/RimL family protein N-acetyltransferase
MIQELDDHRFQAVAPLFSGRREYVPVLAVLTGRFPGRVYTDNADHPTTALVWALGRWAYIDGDPRNSSFNSHLPTLLTSSVFPASLEMGIGWFELYSRGSRNWEATIESSLSALKPERHEETVSVLDRAVYRRSRRTPTVPDGWELQLCEVPIVSEQVRSSGIIPAQQSRRTAFGCRLFDGSRVIALCCSNGFEAGGEFMVEVETFRKEDRGKGYATLAATALIDHAFERALAPLWETTEDNIPSQRLARRLGFVQAESYPVYAMRIPE